MTGSDTSVDTAKLEAYLSEVLDEVVVEIEVLHDSLNVTIGISTAEDEKAFILRRPNKLRHASYINELEQEYEVM